MGDTRTIDYYRLRLLLSFLQRNLLVGQMTDPNHFGSVIFRIWSENCRWLAVISSSALPLVDFMNCICHHMHLVCNVFRIWNIYGLHPTAKSTIDNEHQGILKCTKLVLIACNESIWNIYAISCTVCRIGCSETMVMPTSVSTCFLCLSAHGGHPMKHFICNNCAF